MDVLLGQMAERSESMHSPTTKASSHTEIEAVEEKHAAVNPLLTFHLYRKHQTNHSIEKITIPTESQMNDGDLQQRVIVTQKWQ